MNTKSIALSLLTCVAAVILATNAGAATNIVLSTDDLQTKINEAVPGDILVLQGGTYSGNISITKPLSFVRSGTNDVRFLAPVSIQTTGAVQFIQMSFSETVSSSNSAQVSIRDSLLLSALNGVGGKLSIRRTIVNGAIGLSNSDFEGQRIACPSISASATIGSGARFSLVQSDVTDTSVTGYNCWFGYNTMRTATYADCETVFVGNSLNNGGNTWVWFAVTATRGSLRAYNNTIFVTGNGDTRAGTYKGVHLIDSRGDIANNTIRMHVTGYCLPPWPSYLAYGVLAQDGGGPIRIKGNILQVTGSECGVSVYAIVATHGGQQVTEVAYNSIAGGGVSGIPAYQSLYEDPGLNGDMTLSINSPCINAGPPEVSYNDRNGSRNDIGFTGGPYYQADGKTTNKPFLFWLMPAKQQVWKNLSPTLKVEAAATAGH